ncbi:N-formylglutamate amidohydrolase [Pontibacter sp. HJ8]
MLKLLLTCEHGGNRVPPAYEELFKGHEDVLQTHYGYDIGALDLFNSMKQVADVSFYSETTRLLVELNRSEGHPKLFSEFSKGLSDKAKLQVLKEYYVPYRQEVEHMVRDLVSAGRRVLHVSVHSFTPVLEGEERQADVGLLYDPKRKLERTICKKWKAALLQQDKQLNVRFNYPYLGIADGFPTYLRRKFTPDQYAGIEIEINQKFPEENGPGWQRLKQLLRSTLQLMLEEKQEELSLK